MGLHHPGILSGYDGRVGSEGSRVEANVNPFQEVAQGLFTAGEVCLLKRQRVKGRLIGGQPVCDAGAVAALAHNRIN